MIYYDPTNSSLTLVDPIYKRHYALADTYWLSLLEYAKKEKSDRELKEYLVKEAIITDENLANEFILDLLEQNILTKNSPEIKKFIQQKKEFEKYNWGSAYNYHVYSRDYPFLDYSKNEHTLKDIALMEEYIKKWAPPSMYKEYKNKKHIKLSINDKKMEKLEFPITDNKKVGKLNLESISTLCYLSFGQVGSVHFKVTGEAMLRTSPSGGARHPTEAYLINLGIKDIPIGIYHYSVKDNDLEIINSEDLNKTYKEIFYQLNHVPNFKPKAIIVLTSLAERSMWRYREARSFRVLFFDMGHIVATVRVTASSLGLGASVGDGFKEKELKKLLELNGIGEQPFNFIALS